MKKDDKITMTVQMSAVLFDAFTKYCHEQYTDKSKVLRELIEAVVTKKEGRIELATKTDWKFPEKGELPEKTKEVIVYFENEQGFHSTSVVYEFKEKMFYDYYYDGNIEIRTFFNRKIIAWCELPVF